MLVIKRSRYAILLVGFKEDLSIMEDNLKEYELSFLSGNNIGFDLSVATTLHEAVELAGGEVSFDLAVIRLDLPDSHGIGTMLDFIKGTGDIPVVVVTDEHDHEIAYQAIYMGAQNYILNNELGSSFFPRSLLYAIERHKIVTEKEKLIQDLQLAMERIEKLKGLIPICSHCKKIRNDSGYWEQLEFFISTHSRAEFSHGICPDCVRKYYPDVADEVLEDLSKSDKDHS